MNEKRFWGGAIVAVTAVIAGASALPSLVQRSVPRVIVAAPATMPAQPISAQPRVDLMLEPVVPATPPLMVEVQAPAEPGPQVIGPAPRSVAPPMVREPPAQPEPALLPEPLLEPIKPEPPATLRRVAEPEPAATPIQTAAPVSFPPVQPIGVAAAGQPDSAPAQDIQAMGRVKAKSERHAASVPAGQRKRAVRPAVYPIGEFFAWRR